MIAERISSHAETKWRTKMKQQYPNNNKIKSLKRKFKTRKQKFFINH